MSKSDLKRVRPGDPLEIPAGRANAWTETARAYLEESPRLVRPATKGSPPPGIEEVYNSSAAAVPRYGVVEICEEGNAQELLEICQPGEYSSGSGRYGVAVDSIPAGKVGRIAVGGGPWELQVASSVTPGVPLGGKDGQWSAVQGGETWKCVRGDVDGRAMVRFVQPGAGIWEVVSVGSSTCDVQRVKEFSSGSSVLLADTERTVDFDPDFEPASGDRGALLGEGGGRQIFFRRIEPSGGFYKAANTRFIVETGSTSSKVIRSEQYGSGSWNVQEDTLWVGKFDNPVSVTSANAVFLHNWGDMTYSVEYDTDTGSIQEVEGYFRAKAITENFTLATLTRSDVEALAGLFDPIKIWTQSDPGNENLLRGLGSSLMAGRILPAAAEDIYGMALYWSSWYLSGDNPSGSPIRTLQQTGFGSIPLVCAIQGDSPQSQ